MSLAFLSWKSTKAMGIEKLLNERQENKNKTNFLIVENTWTPRFSNPTAPKHKDDQQKQNMTKKISLPHMRQKKILKFAREKYQVTFKGKPIN